MASTSLSCAACGSVPANHLALWVDNFTDAISLRIPLHRIPFYGFLLRIADLIVTGLGYGGYALGKTLGFVTLTTDVGTAVSDRSKLLWEEAVRRGIDMQQVLLFGKNTDLFRIRAHGKSDFFRSLPLSPEQHALRMDDKVLFKERMRQHSLPVPQSIGATRLHEAQKAMTQMGSVCVKPRTGSNGRHTYPNVHTKEQLAEAFASVRSIGPFVTVEEYLEGDLCRATCVEGVMIGFLQSAYPTIHGDDRLSIAELIEKANGNKKEGVDDIIVDSSVEGFINRRGYTQDSVLPEGTVLALTYRGGTGAGGSNFEHGRNIHPSFIEPIERAARATELHIVGFDIIIPDPQQPADSQKWGFIEANTLPWTDLHAHPYAGTPIDLSPAMWDAWAHQNGGTAIH